MITLPIQPKTKKAVLYIAESQVDITERPANSNRVKYNNWFYGREVSGSAYPWCMAFVEWVFAQAGFNLFKTASCSAMVSRYKQVAPHQLIKSNFKAGDIVFFDFSGKKSKTEHVGICISVSSDGKSVTTIEGNTGVGNEANGGAVMKRNRAIGLITCAVRPNYPD